MDLNFTKSGVFSGFMVRMVRVEFRFFFFGQDDFSDPPSGQQLRWYFVYKVLFGLLLEGSWKLPRFLF